MADTKLLIQLRAEQQRLRADLKKAQRHYKGFSGQIQKQSKVIASSLATAFGGIAVTQALRSGIRKIAQFEFQMDKVAAVSGATAKEVQTLTDNALELGARSKFTATEIGKLQEELARLGFATDEIVNMTDAARKLATVADSELGPSAQSVGKIINAFQLEATDAAEVANIMAESFSKSALDLEKLNVSMGNVGAAAKAAGLSLAETTAMIAKLVDNGIDASKSGTDLRRILINLANSGMTADEAFSQINNSTNKLAAATELFGDRAAGAAIILAKQRDEVRKLTDELSDQNKQLNEMVAIMEDNLLTDFKLFESAIDGVVQKGGALTGVFRQIVQDATALVSVLGQGDVKDILLLIGSGFSANVANQIAAKNKFDTARAAKIANAPFGPFPIPRITVPTIDSGGSGGGSGASGGGQSFGILGQIEGLGAQLETQLAQIPLVLSDQTNRISSNFFELQNTINAGMTEVSLIIDKKGQELNTITLDLGRMITGAFNALIAGFDIGGLRGALIMLQKFLGEAMVSLGQALVQINLGKIALASLPPPAGIAVGVGLIAAGALLAGNAQKKLDNISSSPGLGGGGDLGGQGFRSDAIGQTSLNIPSQVTLKAHGKDLVGVINVTNERQNRIG